MMFSDKMFSKAKQEKTFNFMHGTFLLIICVFFSQVTYPARQERTLGDFFEKRESRS